MTLPREPSWLTNVSVPSTLKIGAMITIWLSSRALCLPSSSSRATSSNASAASGSGGWMLPMRKMTFFPDARACRGEVTRGFESTIAGATLRIGLANMLMTCIRSLFHLSASMYSCNWSVDIVRVKWLFSATVCSSAGQLPFQAFGTESPQ